MLYLCSMSIRYRNDPQYDAGNYLRVDCLEENGPYFICDEDGPISHYACDEGPYTALADAEHELARFESWLEGDEFDF